MNLALSYTETTVERTYEAFLSGQSNPYRKAMKLAVHITTINGQYACHTINDPDAHVTAIEFLEIGAEVLRILKEDEAAKDVTTQINIVNTPSPTAHEEDCPF